MPEESVRWRASALGRAPSARGRRAGIFRETAAEQEDAPDRGVAGAVVLLGLRLLAFAGTARAAGDARPGAAAYDCTGAETLPAFSPDGNTVAFSWNGPSEDNQDIYVQMIDSGEPLRLTTNPNFDTGRSSHRTGGGSHSAIHRCNGRLQSADTDPALGGRSRGSRKGGRVPGRRTARPWWSRSWKRASARCRWSIWKAAARSGCQRLSEGWGRRRRLPREA